MQAQTHAHSRSSASSRQAPTAYPGACLGVLAAHASLLVRGLHPHHLLLLGGGHLHLRFRIRIRILAEGIVHAHLTLQPYRERGGGGQQRCSRV
jgi:hypothetical protein